MTGKDDKNLPYNLENLSIPELEALLQQDFMMSDGSSPDVDYIMAIVEVIHKKEQANPDYQPLDTEKPWEEFKSFYITGEGRETSIYRTSKEAENKSCHAPADKPAPKKSKTLRRYLVIAACVCLLIAMTCVPVFGYHNIIQMLASWTAEQFGFYLPPQGRSAPGQIPEEFEELQEIMQELGAELTIPRFPDGFEANAPKLSYFPDSGILKATIIYQRENEYYIFGVYRNGNNIINQYEKNDSLVETKLYNGIEHYYLANEENNTVAWYLGTIEYNILTNMSISDLEKILEATYEV